MRITRPIRAGTGAFALILGLLLTFNTGCDSADVDDLSGPANVSGLVLDSQAGEPVAGATVTFRRGTGQRAATTNQDGEFSITGIAIGTFTVTIRATGFIEVTLEGVEIADGDNVLPPYVAPTAPPEGSFRIVLSWGEQPRDLDSHLTGPMEGGGRFHVYFANPQPVDYADLDRDDVTSFGPETITVNPRVNGTYRYSVFNFSSQSAAGSQGIAGEIPNSSRARVQLYSSSALIGEWLAPPSTPGNTWRVFEMTAQGNSRSVTTINTYVTASGSSDMTTFRPGMKDHEPSISVQN
jgi:hypothetical protein